MGAWDTGIFDNDNAADFASYVEHCSDVQARHDLFRATLGAELERNYTADECAGDFEFPYETEHALASAAYIADARNGRHQFTDNAYAMGMDHAKDADNENSWYHIELGEPPDELADLAVQVLKKILAQMVRVHVEAEWQEPTREVLEALTEPGKRT